MNQVQRSRGPGLEFQKDSQAACKSAWTNGLKATYQDMPPYVSRTSAKKIQIEFFSP